VVFAVGTTGVGHSLGHATVTFGGFPPVGEAGPEERPTLGGERLGDAGPANHFTVGSTGVGASFRVRKGAGWGLTDGWRRRP